METSKIAVANPLKLYVNIYKTPCEPQRYRIEIDYNNDITKQILKHSVLGNNIKRVIKKIFFLCLFFIACYEVSQIIQFKYFYIILKQCK